MSGGPACSQTIKEQIRRLIKNIPLITNMDFCIDECRWLSVNENGYLSTSIKFMRNNVGIFSATTHSELYTEAQFEL